MTSTLILKERVKPFLEQGEEVRAVLAAGWGRHRLLGLWNYPPIGRSLIVAGTDRGVLVLEAGRWRETHPKRVLMRLPRGSRIGPVTGRMKIHLGGLSKLLGGYVFTFAGHRDELKLIDAAAE